MKNIIDDGINVYFGLQGMGKTYVCTDKAVKELLNPKSTRKVLSNYPIIVEVPLTFKQRIINRILNIYKTDTHTFNLYLKKITLNRYIKDIKSSYVWTDDYTRYSIKDSLIIIDESHDRYTGAYAYELTKEDRKFFSRLRHNGNAVFLMSQSYEDVHPFIRRRMAYLHEITKRKYPWKKTPSCFYVNTYISVKDYLKKDDHKIHKKARRTEYRKKKIPFCLLTGNAYNTHYYRDIRPEPTYTTWHDEINNLKEEVPLPHITETVSNKDIKDSIGALMNLKWKKKEATIAVNEVINDLPLSEVNTVEKIIKKVLQRRANILLDNSFEDKLDKITEEEGDYKNYEAYGNK